MLTGGWGGSGTDLTVGMASRCPPRPMESDDRNARMCFDSKSVKATLASRIRVPDPGNTSRLCGKLLFFLPGIDSVCANLWHFGLFGPWEVGVGR